jgi:hypothetical protein
MLLRHYHFFNISLQGLFIFNFDLFNWILFWSLLLFLCFWDDGFEFDFGFVINRSLLLFLCFLVKFDFRFVMNRKRWFRPLLVMLLNSFNNLLVVLFLKLCCLCCLDSFYFMGRFILFLLFDIFNGYLDSLLFITL